MDVNVRIVFVIYKNKGYVKFTKSWWISSRQILSQWREKKCFEANFWCRIQFRRRFSTLTKFFATNRKFCFGIRIWILTKRRISFSSYFSQNRCLSEFWSRRRFESMSKLNRISNFGAFWPNSDVETRPNDLQNKNFVLPSNISSRASFLYFPNSCSCRMAGW